MNRAISKLFAFSTKLSASSMFQGLNFISILILDMRCENWETGIRNQDDKAKVKRQK